MGTVDRADNTVCWFCGRRAASEREVLVAKFSTGLDVRALEIARCSACARAQTFVDRLPMIGMGLSAGILVAVVFLFTGHGAALFFGNAAVGIFVFLLTLAGLFAIERVLALSLIGVCRFAAKCGASALRPIAEHPGYKKYVADGLKPMHIRNVRGGFPKRHLGLSELFRIR